MPNRYKCSVTLERNGSGEGTVGLERETWFRSIRRPWEEKVRTQLIATDI